MHATLVPPVADPRTASPAAPVPVLRPAPVARRTAVVALVAGSLLNAGQAGLGRYLDVGGASAAAQLQAVDEHPGLVAAYLGSGLVAAALLIVAFQAVAHVVRPRSPRLAATGAALTFVGWLGFLVMGGGAVAQYAAADVEQRAAVVAAFEAVQDSPMGLVGLLPFLVGVFVGAALLFGALLRVPGVPRWIPVAWLAFLVLDLTAQGAMPVDPHVLFVAGALGLAAHVGRRTDAEWLAGPADATGAAA